jgi:hypothetical protein
VSLFATGLPVALHMLLAVKHTFECTQPASG